MRRWSGPAEAEAERIKVLATAEAGATRVRAEAAAANDRVALDQQLIAMLPEVIRGTSDGLAKANITVLNGAEGYNQTVSGLVGQSMAVLESLRAGNPQRCGRTRHHRQWRRAIRGYRPVAPPTPETSADVKKPFWVELKTAAVMAVPIRQSGCSTAPRETR